MTRLERSPARLAALILLALAIPAVAIGQQDAARALPRNFYVAPCLRSTVDAMLERSPTFRAQLEALARARAIGIGIGFDMSRRSPPAEATVRRYESGLLLASIRLHSMVNREELIAHEIEHVLEQVERVSLTQLAKSGNEAWQSGGTFETRRAIDAGKRVGAEMYARDSVTAKLERPLQAR